MKICNQCGSYYADNVVLCTKCGNQNLTQTAQPVAPNPPAYAPNPNVAYTNPTPMGYAPVVNTPYVNPLQASKSSEDKCEVANLLFNIFAVIYTALTFLSVAGAWIDTSFSYYGDYFYSYMNLNEGFLIFAAIAAFLTFVFGIVSLALGLNKNNSLKYKLAGVFRFITALIILVVAALLLIDNI